MNLVPVRLGLQQRVLPEYRAPFFEALAVTCPQGLSVFAGQPRSQESIATCAELQIAQYTPAHNLHLLSGGAYICLQPGFIDWLNEWQPGALIVEANPRYLSTPAAIRWMHARHRPVIGWGLGSPPAAGLEADLRKRFLHTLDAVIAYSKTGAEQYINAGISPERVFVAANAVAPRPTASAFTRPLNYAYGRPVLLFIGRLQERKHVHVLLHACAVLLKEIQPHLVIIGDGPERARLQALAAQVYPQAEFVGARHGSELEPFFSIADLFVLPGTGGLAVQQAMAHSLPVIVGEADGTQAELVRPENGWVLPTSNVETLTAAIQTALQDLPRLRQMGKASYRIVAEEVNLERMVAVFVEAINSVLEIFPQQ